MGTLRQANKRIDDFEPKPTQRELDRREAVFARDVRTLILRILSAQTPHAAVRGHLDIAPLTQAQFTGLLVRLSADVFLLGWNRAEVEIARGRRLQSLTFAVAKVTKRPGYRDLLKTFAISATAAIEAFIARLKSKARDIILRVIVDEGGSIDDGMAAIRTELPTWTNRQAELMARTVSNRAFNAGRIAAFDEAQVEAYEISAILDSRVCPRCRGLDGLIVGASLVKRFYTPPYHYSCRCVVLAVLDESPALARVADVVDAANANVAGMMLSGAPVDGWPGVMDGFGRAESMSVPA